MFMFIQHIIFIKYRYQSLPNTLPSSVQSCHYHRHYCEDENDENEPWYAGHRWRGWREHQDSLPEKICHDEDTLMMMMMTTMMMIKMMMTMMTTMMTWGVEGDEGRHSSAGSIAASPSLTI